MGHITFIHGIMNQPSPAGLLEPGSGISLTVAMESTSTSTA